MEKSLHESDDQLELYALDRLPDAAIERIEEHLILCDPCRNRLEDVGSFALTMRQALKNPAPVRVVRRTGWMEGWQLRFAFGGAIAFALVLGVLAYRNTANLNLPPVATLTLTAMRGAVTPAAHARALDVTLSGTPVGPFSVEVTDAAGKTVWSGAAEIRDSSARVRIAQELAPGSYFVRLRRPGGALLTEYGFSVSP